VRGDVRMGRASSKTETAMDRAQKADNVEALKGVFASAGVVVVGHYAGLTVAEMTTLRTRLRGAGAELKVVKNRLVKIALEGKPQAAGADLFKGPTAIAYSADPIAATKVAVAYAKEKDKFILLGAILGGQVLDQTAVRALATLPSLDELRGKLVGLLQAPATKLAGVIAAPAGGLARVVGAYAAKGEAAA
jgi:large subunit ribosomal protein L10